MTIKIFDCPNKMTIDEIDEIYDLIKNGNQIPNFKKDKIVNSKLVCCIIENSTIVATGVLKNANDSYKKDIFTNKDKSNSGNLNYEIFQEIGYIVVKEAHRGNDLSAKIIKTIIETTGYKNYYATTKNDIMRKKLLNFGFNQEGQNYYNEQNEKLTLYTLTSD